MVYVESTDGSKHLARALLDQGAQMSFISEALSRQLHFKRSQINLQVTGIGSSKPLMVKGLVTFKIFSYHNPYISFNVHAVVLNKLTTYVPVTDSSITKCSHIKGLNLADPMVHKRLSLDIILGAEIYSQIIESGLIKGPFGAPIAQKTSLGWILTGTILKELSTNSVSLIGLQCKFDEDLYELWRRYVLIEDIPPKICKFTLEDDKCDDFFCRTYQRESEGRYMVRLPFKEPNPDLGDSRTIAYKLFMILEKRFEKNLSFKESYVKCIEEYISLGEMSEITDLNELNSEKGYFLPHHGITREISTSTKFRVVFNASQITNLGVSLNGLLCLGPKLQNDISKILLRWRMYPLVFIADIEKMFRRVWIHPEDRTYQKILWRKSPEDELKTYSLNTVTFGFASSPYLVLRTLLQLKIDEGDRFPLTEDVIEKETYVDDVLSGEFEVETAIDKVHEVDSLFRAGGFVLKKWISNNPEILKYIPEDCKATTSVWEPESEICYRPLGIMWSPMTDCFQIRVQFPHDSKLPTKRSVLSDVARIFDPLGWLSPVTIKSKIFLQELWKLKLEWDDELTDSLLKLWSLHRAELSTLYDIRIPRYLKYSKDVIDCELHGFGDASEKAIGAVIYLRLLFRDDSISVSLLTAKTKVAKLKEVSIPRLELCAAVLLVRLMLHVTSTFDSFSKVIHHFWTDSKNTLFWIQSHPSRWNTFISNRVTEIQTSFPTGYWHHVSGIDNPADCASRGITTSSLKDH
ncbi:uncharacterized protein LOC122511131 [Leptopilina heterotoma]|uniref:uncharacterized protein LOC122511131 n=1 Tax=Leptopilina heterotoma TaxID=63436 RepID=UPI001CA99EA7|nr:uncharacterized protein LOC122511131 [Leptopilina heterotoma]